jgi:hypothetical protein
MSVRCVCVYIFPITCLYLICSRLWQCLSWLNWTKPQHQWLILEELAQVWALNLIQMTQYQNLRSKELARLLVCSQEQLQLDCLWIWAAKLSKALVKRKLARLCQSWDWNQYVTHLNTIGSVACNMSTKIFSSDSDRLLPDGLHSSMSVKITVFKPVCNYTDCKYWMFFMCANTLHETPNWMIRIIHLKVTHLWVVNKRWYMP